MRVAVCLAAMWLTGCFVAAPGTGKYVGPETQAMPEPETVEAVEDEATDTELAASDAGSQTTARKDGGATKPKSDAGAAAEPPPPPPPPPPVDVDAGTSDDATAPAVDEELPCVDYVDVPTSPRWIMYAAYTLVDTPEIKTVKYVPYTCPKDEYGLNTIGEICKYALGNPTGGKATPYPFGSCRLKVPDACLPCTKGKTEL